MQDGCSLPFKCLAGSREVSLLVNIWVWSFHGSAGCSNSLFTICFFCLVKSCVVLQLTSVRHIHTHYSSMFPSKTSALLVWYPNQGISFSSLASSQVNCEFAGWGSVVHWTQASSPNPAHASAPAPSTSSAKTPLQLLMQDSTLPFVYLLQLGKTEESDLLPVWSDRQGPQDRPCLCHFSQTRTWKNCYSFCTFCKSHFYLHFVAFIVSLALPPCFSRTPGNCWECQTSHLLWPTPHAFFTTEMAPACCVAFLFYPTPGMDWAGLQWESTNCGMFGGGKGGGGVMHCGHRHPISVNLRELWRVQKGWATLLRARGNHLHRAGRTFAEIEK